MRESLGLPPLLLAALLVGAAPGHPGPEAPKPVADSQPLWSYDTGG
jgi:hypothetical protein